MPCYIHKPKPKTLGELLDAVDEGGLKSGHREHTERERSEVVDMGDTIFMCSRDGLGPHCHGCGDFGDLLCDWPMGGGKTCDIPMCESHSHDLGDDKHLCEVHFRLFHAAGADRVNVWPPKRASKKTKKGTS